MSNVYSLDDYRAYKRLRRIETSAQFTNRMNRIKHSLHQINGLIAELRQSSKDEAESMNRYELAIYDLWGNKREGFEVNDVNYTGQIIEINDSDNTIEIIRALKVNGIVSKYLHNSKFNVWGEGYCLYIEYSGKPICELIEA